MTSTVILMKKYIQNYVWHSVFGNLDRTCTTRRTKTVTSLPSLKRVMSLPDLRDELLALAAVTLTKWGATLAGYKQLLGDYLITGATASGAQPIWVTRGNTGRLHAKFRQGKTYGLLRRRFGVYTDLQAVNHS